MTAFQSRSVASFFLLILFSVVFETNVSAQSVCLSEPEIKKIVDEINNPKETALNQNLQLRLRNLKLETAQIYDQISRLPTASPLFEERLRMQKERNIRSFCQILREYGWVSRALVGAEGGEIAAAIFLDSPSAEFQQQLISIMEAAFKTGEISKSNWARITDQARVQAGKKQIFGTLVGISKDLLVLYPIENETNVDKLRREYELPPLIEQIRRLEQKYQAVVFKPAAQSLEIAQTVETALKRGKNGTEKSLDEEVLQIETNLVNLNATVLPEKPGAALPPLGKNDFIVSENGIEQSIEYFAQTQIPFDITLLIDISGSTSNKNKLIRRTTRSFIKAARPADRLSVVVFDEETTVVAALTEDRQKLLAAVETIQSGGGSQVWDALGWSLDQITKKQKSDSPTEERRSAVVFITDGADNGFVNDRDASDLTFAALLEKTRQSTALVIPIHLDTREDYGLSEKLYLGTRRALNLLADESGGLFYEARKFDDLTNVYTQVINDLSKVYSLGYSPANATRDNLWRTVKINLKNNPALRVRSRKGYYAR